MKKLIAILLSALMLCTLMSFATVSAEDLITIEIATVESANAGDEIEVSVNLNDIPEGKGLIGCQIEILFDSNVFELVTYFDEDEEMYMPQIEVNSKYNDKFIMFAPVDDDGYSERCLVQYLRATAKETQLRYEADFYTATFKVKDNAPSGTYTLTLRVDQGEPMTLKNEKVPYTLKNAEIAVKGEEPACEHEYAYDCSKNCSKCGEETRPEAAHQYFYACDAHCMICNELTNPEAAHSLTHVDAKPATCTENGNIEYWFCEACGGCWDNENATGMPLNRFMVIVPMVDHTYFDDCSAICDVCGYEREVSHNVIHVEAVPATCTTEGNIEYWYCDKCGQAWLDAECTLNTNLKSVVLPASCSYGAVYTAAKEATCYEPGNTEYWYCANCDVYYADAACAIVTNAKNVIIPITHNIIAVEAKAATCTAEGNIAYWYCADCGQAWLDELCHLNTNLKAVILPMAEHTYANAHDDSCDVCGAIREIVLDAEDVILDSGNSISELKNGLAYKFDVAAKDVVIGADYIADYSNAKVAINGVDYKLITMGVVTNNKGLADQTLENVDGKNILNVEAKKAFELDGVLSYAVRVINIPADKLDVEIIVRSYFIYENAEGEQVTVYGDDWKTSYNAEISVG